MRILVDTNVFVDLLFQRDDKWKDALNFFIWCRRHKNQAYVTSVSLRDIEYIAHKRFHNKNEANKILNRVYANLCTKVIGVSADCAINAIFEDYKDYEDELQIQAAKENLLDVIVTNNIKDFKDRGIPVFTPKEISTLELD